MKELITLSEKTTRSQPELLSHLFPKLRTQPFVFLPFGNPKMIFDSKALVFLDSLAYSSLGISFAHSQSNVIN